MRPATSVLALLVSAGLALAEGNVPLDGGTAHDPSSDATTAPGRADEARPQRGGGGTGSLRDPGDRQAIDRSGGRPGGVDTSQRAGLTQTQVMNTIKPHLASVRACYDARHKAKPDLAGSVTVHFEISPTGAVTKASAASRIDKALEACIVGQAKTWQFPAASARSATDFPFSFSTK